MHVNNLSDHRYSTFELRVINLNHDKSITAVISSNVQKFEMYKKLIILLAYFCYNGYCPRASFFYPNGQSLESIVKRDS